MIEDRGSHTSIVPKIVKICSVLFCIVSRKASGTGIDVGERSLTALLGAKATNNLRRDHLKCAKSV